MLAHREYFKLNPKQFQCVIGIIQEIFDKEIKLLFAIKIDNKDEELNSLYKII